MNTARWQKIRLYKSGCLQPGTCKALALGLLLAVAVSANAEDVITSKVEAKTPDKKFNSNEWRAISLSGGRILHHVDRSTHALADKDTTTASANIDKAMTLVDILDGVLPSTHVKTDISGAGLTYHDEDDVQPAFVPIYHEYDQVDVLSPVKAAKQQASDKTSENQNDEDMAYSYAGLDYTGVLLNVDLANKCLNLARDLIKDNKIGQAMDALHEIQVAGVIFEFSRIDEPLVQAMDNLRLAESEMKSNHPQQAKDALDSAMDALQTYEKLTGDKHSKDVQQLRNEIHEVRTNLNNHTPQSFTEKISDWWNRCRNWFNK